MRMPIFARGSAAIRDFTHRRHRRRHDTARTLCASHYAAAMLPPRGTDIHSDIAVTIRFFTPVAPPPLPAAATRRYQERARTLRLQKRWLKKIH